MTVFLSDSSCLFKPINKIFAAFLVTPLIIFIWSSSTIIISDSNVHVCVTSRKLNNRYCVYAGAHYPTSNNNNPFSFIKDNNSSQISNVHTNFFINNTNNTQIAPISDKNEALALSPSSEFSRLPQPVIHGGMHKAKAEEKENSMKVVEAQIAILRSYIAKINPSNCEGRGIYVYDLPSKFNKDLITRCNEIVWHNFCNYFSNNGMGEAIPKLGKGWYNTHQFLLEPIIHQRILKHPCRVSNITDAKLYYVPFYGALDMIWSHFSNVPSESNAHVLSREIAQWLNHQEMWKRNSGLDHVFILGKNSWDLRRLKNVPWGTPLLELDELQNPIKLIIERQPWHINDVGVPYPTYFHPSSDDEIIAWQVKIKHTDRKYLISFAGATRTDPKSIRSILIEQCTTARDTKTCNFLNCDTKKCVESGALVVELFMDSEFCLQPDGDSPTRKSLFDSLIAGCIPIVFDPFAALYQYPWHLPEDYKKYSVFIDQDEVKKSEVNVVEKLKKIPLKERQEMRKYIIDELMPRLVYANVDAKLKKFEDAFTIAVNNAVQMAIRRLN